MKISLKLATYSLAFFGLIVATACREKNTDPSPPVATLKDAYDVHAEGLYPEGIDYDTEQNLFVFGSFNKGKVYTLSGDGKQLKTLISDPKLTAVLGVYTDEKRGRYIVAGGDVGASEQSGSANSTAGKQAYLGIYNSTSGEVIASIDLKPLTPESGALPNDIAVDQDGNIYVTDSFSPIIYKVDNDYKASVFVNNPQFGVAPGSFGLNGIVYHADGYLIVSKTSDNQLFKVMLDAPDKPVAIQGISGAIKAPDGLEWTTDGKLVVVENGLAGGKAFVLDSNDAWKSATIVEQEVIGSDAFPTTAVAVPGNGVYILQSQLGALLGGNKAKEVFQIKKAAFK